MNNTHIKVDSFPTYQWRNFWNWMIFVGAVCIWKKIVVIGHPVRKIRNSPSMLRLIGQNFLYWKSQKFHTCFPSKTRSTKGCEMVRKWPLKEYLLSKPWQKVTAKKGMKWPILPNCIFFLDFFAETNGTDRVKNMNPKYYITLK